MGQLVTSPIELFDEDSSAPMQLQMQEARAHTIHMERAPQKNIRAMPMPRVAITIHRPRSVPVFPVLGDRRCLM